jgi:hypothetical protein
VLDCVTPKRMRPDDISEMYWSISTCVTGLGEDSVKLMPVHQRWPANEARIQAYYFHTLLSSLPSGLTTILVSSITSTMSRYEHATLSPYFLAYPVCQLSKTKDQATHRVLEDVSHDLDLAARRTSHELIWR